LKVVRDRCECDQGQCPHDFEDGIIVVLGKKVSLNILQFPRIVEGVFGVKKWRYVNHNEAHALLGYHASPFRSALVVTVHGAGNDGPLSAFLGSGFDLHRLANLNHSLGLKYLWLEPLFPEVSGFPIHYLCEAEKENPGPSDGWMVMGLSDSQSLAYPGKFMGYSGINAPDSEIRPSILEYFLMETPDSLEGVIPRSMIRMACSGTEGQRSLAASVQAEFSRAVQVLVKKFLDDISPHEDVEGIVLAGGSALNVLMNQLVRDTLTMASGAASADTSRRPVDVYVPPAPSDTGLVVGALWAVEAPHVRQPLQYLGFRLWDEHILDVEAHKRGARKLSLLGGAEHLASLLAGGPPWLNERHRQTDNPIIAVVRGRQEFGPRALGHRSLLAVPSCHDMRKRLNKLKFREWWRPVAPMIADEALVQVFGHAYKSPYMEMAPQVRSDVLERFPALAHFDGTARHQSVGESDEPWLHSLLLAVGRRTGLAALINTSFNSKGKPIVNTISESLKMLDEHVDLDYVLIEDWLFQAPPRQPDK